MGLIYVGITFYLWIDFRDNINLIMMDTQQGLRGRPPQVVSWCKLHYYRVNQVINWLSYLGGAQLVPCLVSLFGQCPLQEPKLEVPTTYKVYVQAMYVRGYALNIVQYLRFRCLKRPLIWVVKIHTFATLFVEFYLSIFLEDPMCILCMCIYIYIFVCLYIYIYYCTL